jgi:hypothetical protein
MKIKRGEAGREGESVAGDGNNKEAKAVATLAAAVTFDILSIGKSI